MDDNLQRPRALDVDRAFEKDITSLETGVIREVLLIAAKDDPDALHQAGLVCSDWLAALPAPEHLHVSSADLSHGQLGADTGAEAALIAWLQRFQRGRSLRALSIRLPPELWGYTSTPDATADTQFLSALLDAVQLPQLEQLELGAGWGISAASLQLLGARLPQLVGLRLGGGEGLQQRLDLDFAQALPQQLTQLELDWLTLGEGSAASLAHLTRLARLTLEDADISDADMSTLASALTRLTHLNVCGHELSSTGVRELARLTGLAMLNVSRGRLMRAGVRTLAKSLTRVVSLAVGSSGLDGKGAAEVAAMTQLRSLDISGNLVGDEGACALASSLTQLTSLFMRATFVGERGAAALSRLVALASLDMTGCRPGSAGMRSLASALTGLESLTVRACNLDAEAALELLALTGLRELEAAEKGISSADVVRSLAASLTRLTSISLDSAATSEGLAALTPLTRLRKLNICGSHATAPDPAGVLELQALPSLVQLALCVSGTGDAHARSLAPLTRLTGLTLSCNALGAAGVGALARLTCLRSLSLQRMMRLDPPDWATVQLAGAAALAALTQLTLLRLSGYSVAPQHRRVLERALTRAAQLRLGEVT